MTAILPPKGEKGKLNMVFVLDNNKTQLSLIHPAAARRLLDDGKAAVYKSSPFTIIMKGEQTHADTARHQKGESDEN